MPLSLEEQNEQQQRFMLLAEMLEMTEGMEEFVQRGNHAAAFGCYVDPTLWRKGINNLEFINKAVGALVEARGKIIKARQEAIKRAS